MQLSVYSILNTSTWRTQLNALKNFSSRTKLLILIITGVSLSVITAGVVLRQRRRRYRAKSLSSVGGALSRQNTFSRPSALYNRLNSSASSSSSHRRVNSFPMISVTNEGIEEATPTEYNIIEDSNRPSRSSAEVLQIDDDLLKVDGDVFLSLSQNTSAGVLSEEFYDVSPDLSSLITSYPVMTDKGGVVNGDFLSDSDESFQSANETLTYMGDRHALYLTALALAENDSIKCRRIRTSLLGCSGDRDFLAKVHCIRQAFNHLLLIEENRQYAINAGKELIMSLLRASNTDPQPFISRYHEILDFVQDSDNWPIAEEELNERGVTCLNIYDVALDFMLMDAFDDLSSPPSALLSVIQNGWISDGIKQSMLNTAVWSILKAKKSVVKNKNGFLTKFYLLSETMSPVFAWGFLGSNGELKKRCLRFKSGVMLLIRSMFSLEDVRYGTTQTLADDIMRLTRQTINSLSSDSQ